MPRKRAAPDDLAALLKQVAAIAKVAEKTYQEYSGPSAANKTTGSSVVQLDVDALIGELRAESKDPKKTSSARTDVEGSANLRRYLASIAGCRITKEREKILGTKIKAAREEGKADIASINELAEGNAPFVPYYVKRYRGCGISYLDLIGEGNIGLLEAARRFDPGKRVKFITYAVWWVRQVIIHALAEHAGQFRFPQKIANQIYRMKKTQAILQNELGRRPEWHEVAARMELDPEELVLLMGVSDDGISLDAIIDEEHEFRLVDKLEQSTERAASDRLLERDAAERVRAEVDALPEKHSMVLRQRFGMDTDDPGTLREIGESMNLSRERIRQIEAQALKRLRDRKRLEDLRAGCGT